MRRPGVAIIGGGVAGLGAAHALADSCDVTILESSPWLGGHANTQDVLDRDGTVVPVDTGFIVYNEATYPELTALFAELDVPTAPSDMSMSVSCAGCGLEYAGRRPMSVVRALARRPRTMGRLLVEIARFMRLGRAELAAPGDADETFDAWARRHGFTPLLRTHFLVPVLAAVWSAPPGRALDMPARYILGFLDNHGLLGRERIEWRTVRGGSREYVRRLRDSLERRGARVRLATPVRRVERTGDEVAVCTDERETFDYVVLATHADDSLRLLDAPTELERRTLGAWTYTESSVVLHDDAASFLPNMRAARASWNYHLPDCAAAAGAPTLSYWMNSLQPLRTRDEFVVTLNADPSRLAGHERYAATYRHPQYSAESLRAQASVPELLEATCETRTAFCGAWQGYGFHEDGLRSGLTTGRHLAALAALAAASPTPSAVAEPAR